MTIYRAPKLARALIKGICRAYLTHVNKIILLSVGGSTTRTSSVCLMPTQFSSVTATAPTPYNEKRRNDETSFSQFGTWFQPQSKVFTHCNHYAYVIVLYYYKNFLKQPLVCRCFTVP